MKIFGSISRLVSIIFRKDGQDVTFRPNQSTTYTAARDIQLPAGDADHELVGKAASQTLTNKSMSGDDNTFSNIGISSLKTALSDADKLLLRDVSGAVVSAKLEDKHVAANAAIALSKLAALTASKVLVSDGSGVISASSVTSTELGYLSGVTSGIQSQLDALSASSSGALADAVSDLQDEIAALTTADIAEDPSNKYFTDARAQTAAVVDTGYAGTETNKAPSVRAVVAAIQDVTDALNSLQSDLEDADDALAADIASEASARASADSTLQTNINNEASARASAISSEASTRASADSALQAEIDAEEVARAAADAALDARLDVLEGADTVAGSVAKALKDAKAYTDAETSARQSAVSAEQSAREAADAALDARLDILEGSAATVGSVAKAEADAKAYADQKIADLIDGAPALLDTLNELAAAIGDDQNFVTTITTSISNETSARQAADTTLQGNIDALELALEAADADLAADIAAEQARAEAAEATLQSNINLKLNKPSSGDAADKYLRSNGDGSTYWDVGYILPVYKTNWSAASGTSKTVSHNLGSTDVVVSLVDLSDNQVIGVDSIVITDSNTVTLSSSESPSVAGWRVIVQKI
jgi:hypothetical protein